MVLGFFQNACILITFISIGQHFLRNKNIIIQNLSKTQKSIFGISAGILGILLMLNSVHIAPNIIIDFRYIPILLSSLYGGFLTTIISSIIIGVFRLFFL